MKKIEKSIEEELYEILLPLQCLECKSCSWSDVYDDLIKLLVSK